MLELKLNHVSKRGPIRQDLMEWYDTSNVNIFKNLVIAVPAYALASSTVSGHHHTVYLT